MLPAAYVAHQTRDRIRFRIPARKGDTRFFADLEQAFAALGGVAYVEANPLTGSVLLRHTVDPDELTRYALEQRFFTLQPDALPEHTVLNLVSTRLDQFDYTVQRTTGGAVDLNELLFIGVLAASAIQLLRGKALGPASALLSYAAAILASHRAKRAAE